MAWFARQHGTRLGQRTGGFAKRSAARLLVLAILLAGLLAALPVARVRANAPVSGNVTVRVTIEKVSSTVCFDPTGLGCGSEADFYPVVDFLPGSVCTPVAPATTDGDVPGGCRAPAVIDKNSIPSPGSSVPPWQFDATVDYGQVASLPLSIKIFDEDGGLRFGDDVADISPLGGSSGLALQVDLTTTPCTILGAGGGPCSQGITVQGNGDPDYDATMVYRVDVLNPLVDTDGDGIPDDWEQNGVSIDPDGDGPVAPQLIDLPAMGAQVAVPDIFVQADWMQGTDAKGNPVDQRIKPTDLNKIVAAFANAPTRINMHIDNGQDSPLNCPPGTAISDGGRCGDGGGTITLPDGTSVVSWGSLSRAQQFGLQTIFGTSDGKGLYNWSTFQSTKDQAGGFTQTGRSPIFHYTIAVFNLPGDVNAGGISRNDRGGLTAFLTGASDFLIAQGSSGSFGRALTLMHELGHNLGLTHGGNDFLNYKPNYLSIMNYLFSTRGLEVRDSTGVHTDTLDYSRQALPTLDETQLSESLGLNAPGVDNRGTGHLCVPDVGANPPITYDDFANGPIDWDCKSGTSSPVNVNGDGVCVKMDIGGNGVLDTTPANDDVVDPSGTAILDGPNRTCNTTKAIDDLQVAAPGTAQPNLLPGFNDWANLKFKGGAIGALGRPALPMLTPGEEPMLMSGPTVDAGGPYEVAEGGSVVVTASASDPDGGPLSYVWDLDHNGSFETPGQSVTFSAASLSAPSSHTIQVQVTDDTGLRAVDQAIVNVIYNFSGFFQPVDNLPIFNTLKAGSAAPVKFSLSGDQGLDIFESGYPKSQLIPCDSTAPVDGIEETVAAGSSSLSYNPSTDQYSYVWKTDKEWAGTCRQLVVKLNDGTSHRANFQFTK
jgi:hypothetical protein